MPTFVITLNPGLFLATNLVKGSATLGCNVWTIDYMYNYTDISVYSIDVYVHSCPITDTTVVTNLLHVNILEGYAYIQASGT